MLVKWPRLPCCTHRFVVTGLNLERFINAMQKADIPLLHLYRQDRRTLKCECHSCDLPAVSALADEKGWRIQNIVPCGVSALCAGIKKRPGIPIGIVLALIAAIALSQFVWRIEVCNAGPYKAEILTYLQESGYGPGVHRMNVDARKLEQTLLYRYPEITWFHVYVSNITLVVEVTHGVSMPDLPSSQPCDIIASRDGVIDSIRVFAGTAMVKSGDTVQKGQVLIRGEERGSDGELLPVHAEGAVTARCWQTQTVKLPLLEIHSMETGREQQQTRIYTPWFSFPEKWESPPFLAYNTYVEETPVAGVFFPVTYQRMVQREVAMEYAKRNEDEVRKEAFEAAFRQLKETLYGYEIIDKWADYCMIEDESLSASVTAEWLMDIGEESPP